MKEIKFTPDEAGYIKKVLAQEESKTAKHILSKISRAEKRIQHASAKAKGRNLQYWVCERIAGMFGIKFDQNDNDCEIHSREMGQNGTDIVLRGNCRRLFPFSVECKACETLNVPEWIEQASKNVEKDKDWLLVVKKQSIGKPIAIMDFGAFEKIMQEYLYESSN